MRSTPVTIWLARRKSSRLPKVWNHETLGGRGFDAWAWAKAFRRSIGRRAASQA
jgi:hypothetical protein